MKDKSYLEKFYREANSLNSEIQGYTNVILRGPNATPIELSIEPIQRAGDKIVLTFFVFFAKSNIVLISEPTL